jgi:hypothetical protein
MQRAVAERIASSPSRPREPVADSPDSGVCELAESTLGAERLVVRRVHLHAQEDQGELFAYWRHFAFVSNRSEHLQRVEREHRQHAEVELAIRPQRAGARPLSWRVLRRKRRLDRDRLPGPQPSALDRHARPTGRDPTHGPDDPPLAARHPRSPHTHPTTLDTSPARPLALAAQLHRRAHPHPRASQRRLIAHHAQHSPPASGRHRAALTRARDPLHAGSRRPAIQATDPRPDTPGHPHQNDPQSPNTTDETVDRG